MDSGVAFGDFIENLLETLKDREIAKLKIACVANINSIIHCSVSQDLNKDIKAINDPGELLTFLCGDLQYLCNWINIRILEIMSKGFVPAETIVEEYKNEIYSRELIVCDIPNLNIPKNCFTMIEERWNKDITNMAVKDFIKHWIDIEELLHVKGCLLLHHVNLLHHVTFESPVEIVWLLSNGLVNRAYDSFTKCQPTKGCTQLLIELSYLKIGEHHVKDSRLLFLFVTI